MCLPVNLCHEPIGEKFSGLLKSISCNLRNKLLCGNSYQPNSANRVKKKIYIFNILICRKIHPIHVSKYK